MRDDSNPPSVIPFNTPDMKNKSIVQENLPANPPNQ